ncbi:hypothetical protein ACFQVA_21000 [Actinomadura keratinilytica]
MRAPAAHRLRGARHVARRPGQGNHRSLPPHLPPPRDEQGFDRLAARPRGALRLLGRHHAARRGPDHLAQRPLRYRLRAGRRRRRLRPAQGHDADHPREARAAVWAVFGGAIFGYLHSLSGASILRCVGLGLALGLAVFVSVFYRYYTKEPALEGSHR